jgi:CRISPR-associated protein Cmr3
MSTLPFAYQVQIEPLGLLHGSSGRLLSPEVLTGRAAEHFPPDAPAAAGLIASQLPRAEVWHLHTAGPFWVQPDGELMLPAPMALIQEEDPSGRRFSRQRLQWREGDGSLQPGGWWEPAGTNPTKNRPSGGWIALSQWPHPANPTTPADGLPIHGDPWRAVPHLHPRLREEERVSAKEGALFLEYGMALQPGVRLAYLSSHALPDGLMRFGGEGHLAQVRCLPLPPLLAELLRLPLAAPFALLTPGLWGGPKLSIREPIDTTVPRGHFPWHRHGQPPGILTDRPRPWRHRLGAGSRDPSPGSQAKPDSRRLSRGRWAVPAGSCYQLAGDPLPPWVAWPDTWFPKEGFSFKQLGTALALSLT